MSLGGPHLVPPPPQSQHPPPDGVSESHERKLKPFVGTGDSTGNRVTLIIEGDIYSTLPASLARYTLHLISSWEADTVVTEGGSGGLCQLINWFDLNSHVGPEATTTGGSAPHAEVN